VIWPFTRSTRAQEPAPPAGDVSVLLRQARRLRFRVRPDAVTALAGAYHGARPGVGLTFSELRAYEPGDDVRHLDWNVTARQGRPYVRRFVEERALAVWLLVDVSASMRFAREGRTKADRAAQAAALLAAAAIQNGDRVGLLLVSDRVELELRPHGGVRHFARIVRALVATPSTSAQTRLSVALERIRRVTRRALLVVLSDFHAPEPAGVWRPAAVRHSVVAVRVFDPLEDALPDAGLVALIDPETRARRVVDTSDARVRDVYARAAAARRAVFGRWCAEAGVAALHLDATDDPIGPLLNYFRGHAATGRGASRP
jgi:uncharacterized protein (DUF58 family)